MSGGLFLYTSFLLLLENILESETELARCGMVIWEHNENSFLFSMFAWKNWIDSSARKGIV